MVTPLHRSCEVHGVIGCNPKPKMVEVASYIGEGIWYVEAEGRVNAQDPLAAALLLHAPWWPTVSDIVDSVVRIEEYKAA